MNKEQFDEFFAVHSQNVDNAKSLGFWSLTDKLLEEFLMEQIPVRKHIHLVDLGGGTGRWLQALDHYFENCQFTIVDLSDDMLGEAQKKIDAGRFKNDIRLIKSDISSIPDLTSDSVDYIISTYNPLSFVPKPQLAINEAYRVLKSGGTAMITVQSYYNALYSKLNNNVADAPELLSILHDKKVKWNPTVPALWQLRKQDMNDLFIHAGFTSVEFRGIATIIQPQGEDFDPENKQLGSISKKLNEDPTFYDAVLEVERKASTDQNAIDRAMNILTIGVK
jgi:ubiquinone/menaquinone biosynthesis C-methylase UbiE